MPVGIYKRTKIHCERISLSHCGKKNPGWKGGEYKNARGYVLSLASEHPFRNCGGYVLKHRLVMEAKLGRFLTRKEVVHHINGIKDDNRPENLIIFTTNSKHLQFHGEQTQIQLFCKVCSQPFFVKRSLIHKRKNCSKRCCNISFKGRSLNSGRTHFKKGMTPWNKKTM